MGWSALFLASLDSGGGSLEAALGPLGSPYLLPASELLSAPSITGASLRPRSWESAASTCTLTVSLARALDIVRLGRPGVDLHLYLTTSGGRERVWSGRLRSVEREADLGPLVLVADSLEVLAQGPYPLLAWRDGLFATQCASTTVGPGSYTPGSGSVPVGSSMAAALLPDGDGAGGELALAEIQGPDGTFYVSWTSMGGGYLGGEVVEWVPIDVAASVCAVGTVVRVGPLLRGPPWRTLLRVLLGGTGTSLRYGDLPASASWQVPEALVDVADAERCSVAMRAIGYAYTAHFGLIEPAAGSEGSALLQWAASLGVWLCQRQGQLTVRCAVDPWDSDAWSAFGGTVLAPADVVRVGRWTGRHPDCIPEHAGISGVVANSSGEELAFTEFDRHVAGGGGTRAVPRTRPASTEGLDLRWPAGSVVPPFLASTSTTTAERGAHTDDLARRLAPYATRLVAVVELTLRGRHMGLAAGDLVELTGLGVLPPDGTASTLRGVWVPQAWDWAARTVAGVVWLVSQE